MWLGCKGDQLLGLLDDSPRNKPWRKLIEAILQMDRPRSNTDVRAFIGAVNHYKYLWPRRAHVLALLAQLTGRDKFQWDSRHQISFYETKAIICADAINMYPDYNYPFNIYTDALDFQLGDALIQNGRPLDYFSKKLTSAQKNYTKTEKELLAIVLTLKEYRQMLIRCIRIYTDHKNLTCKTFSVQRILQWRIFLDEFDTTIHYIEGKKNVLADCFSRLPRMEKPSVGDSELQDKGTLIDFEGIEVPKDDQEIDGESFVCVPDTAISECLLNLPPLIKMNNPITITSIVNHQGSDLPLQQKRIQDSDHYEHQEFQQFDVICFKATNDELWSIGIPESLAKDVLTWYHLVLGHCGMDRLHRNLSARFVINKLKEKRISATQGCPDKCQQYTPVGRSYGHLPPRHAKLKPWEDVAVDLIGP